MTTTYSFVFAHGCRRAEADIYLFKRYFDANGLVYTDHVDKADMVLVCGCSFDLMAEMTSLRLIQRTLNKLPERSRVFVVGCISGISRDKLKTSFGSRIQAVSPKDMGEFDAIIDAHYPLLEVFTQKEAVRSFMAYKHADSPIGVREPSPDELVVQRGKEFFSSLDRFWGALVVSRTLLDKVLARTKKWKSLKGIQKKYPQIPSLLLSRGCLGDCTYCAINIACGPQHSVKPEAVRASLDKYLVEGFTHVALVAQDVGAYGRDIGTSIVALLEDLLAVDRSFKLVITDFNPRWLVEYGPKFVSLVARHADKIDNCIIPIQSGSNRILGMMQRHYRVEDVMEVLHRLRAAVPDLLISTHVMVGFPGETDEDFRQTLEMVTSFNFFEVSAFRYDDRPGTQASSFPDKVPGSVKTKRLYQLRKKLNTA